MVSAALKSLCPGAMRLMAADDGTSTWRVSPASVFTVNVLPLIALMVPKKWDGAWAFNSGVATSNAQESAMHAIEA
jgi:hypothetical protein